MLSPQDLQELEQQIEKLIDSFCGQRCGSTACILEYCPIRMYLPSRLNVMGPSRLTMDRRIQKLLRILDQEWNTPIRLADLARRVGLSSSRLSYLFKKETGVSLIKALREWRLWSAANLLITTDMRVSEVCYSVGFEDVSNFNHAFRKKYGVSPTQLRSRGVSQTTVRATLHAYDKKQQKVPS